MTPSNQAIMTSSNLKSRNYDVIVVRHLTPVRRTVTERWRWRLIDLYDITRIPSIFLRWRHNNVSWWCHVVMWRHSEVTLAVVEGEIDVLRVVVHVVILWRHNRTLRMLWRHNWSRVLGLRLVVVVLLVLRAFFCVARGSVKKKDFLKLTLIFYS